MRKRVNKKYLLFLLATLPLLVFLVQNAQRYLSFGEGTPASIVVETEINLGPLPQPWQALAQGGEEREQRLANVVGLIKPLSPRYIRLDHIFDGYDVVAGEKNGKMTFDFLKLDLVVNDILATGALPMFSLSYMPLVISSGDITSPPTDWLDWQAVVRATIEHYSGKNQKNITDVLYEVWNEPDLFGNWKISGDKDYRLLYAYAAQGANQAKGVNAFKIGGPATTAFYKNWLEEFVKYVYEKNLRLDFFSWHKYSLDPLEYLADINFIDSLLTKHGGSYLLPKFITEWGSVSENSTLHDGSFDAAHMVAVIRQILDRVDLAFTFEIKDGRSPTAEKFWGRWGILTHESTGLIKKPRYFALLLLNKIKGDRLKITGEGTRVTGFAAKNGETTSLILVNYDRQGVHTENVPVTFTAIKPGIYTFNQTFLGQQTLTTMEEVATFNLSKTFFMPANSVLLLELKKT